MPARIQRRRTKGWRMPAGAVCVTRPGRWGNPFRAIEGTTKTAGVVTKFFRECLERAIRGHPLPAGPGGGALADGTVEHFRRMAAHLPELRGKTLVCWCPAGFTCHADVLLELANAKGMTP